MLLKISDGCSEENLCQLCELNMEYLSVQHLTLQILLDNIKYVLIFALWSMIVQNSHGFYISSWN